MKLLAAVRLYAARMLEDNQGMRTVPPDPKKFKVIDSRYGTFISSWDTEQEATKAATARPYSKVITGKIPGQYGKGRQLAKRRLMRSNPDVP